MFFDLADSVQFCSRTSFLRLFRPPKHTGRRMADDFFVMKLNPLPEQYSSTALLDTSSFPGRHNTHQTRGINSWSVGR
jgi:hypothetical protein